jgi:hypothetical protein
MGFICESGMLSDENRYLNVKLKYFSECGVYPIGMQDAN